ncbi:CBP domain-containing protein [Mycena venus]|uniref:CBP domain-containing protein n=1 Tax=Mycena venus TaxID=2733690 RepID=A0A8H7D7S9_9AGAR|nr:CBP domain-containing protein [Mycena venus]
MQFSLVAILALAAGALAAPAPLFRRQNTCDIKNCVLDLAPSVVSCGSAAAQLVADPVADAGCLIAAAKDVVDLPPSCNGCAQQLGITLPTGGVIGSIESGLSSAGDAIKGGLSSLGSDISGLF